MLTQESTTMMQRTARRGTQVLRLWLAMALPLAAQSGSQQAAKCAPGAKADTCQAAPAQPQGGEPAGKASEFAFPLEDSKHGANPDGTPSSSGSKPAGSLPDMPTSGVPDPPASSNVPVGDAGSSSSSGDNLPPGTSSSRDGADPDDDIAPTTAAADAPIKSAHLKDLGSRGDSSAARARLEQTRVADDIKVGLFYTKDGNAQGAYLRFKDALDHDPTDPEVRFYLAESASRINKRDEAVLNYREYLQLDPGGDHDKASRKALARFGAAVH